MADLYPQLGQKNFCDFLEGDSGGHSYSQDTSDESFWSLLLSFAKQLKNWSNYFRIVNFVGTITSDPLGFITKISKLL